MQPQNTEIIIKKYQKSKDFRRSAHPSSPLHPSTVSAFAQRPSKKCAIPAKKQFLEAPLPTLQESFPGWIVGTCENHITNIHLVQWE